MRGILIVLFSLLSLSAFSAPELKGNPEDLRGFLHPKGSVITISDSALETAYSDTAIVHLVVSTEAKQLSQAIQKNTQIRTSIRQQLKAKGISDSAINNSKFSSSPEYGWFDKEPSSYKVINRISIKIQLEQHLQDIAIIADAQPEALLSGSSFEHSQKYALTQNLKKQALEKVIAKKTFYEKALNIKLIATSFRESTIDNNVTEGANLVQEIIVSGIRSDRELYKSRNFSDAPKLRANSFDEIKYEAHISIDFKVEN
ncbi:MAG: hypothetical protein ACI93R_001927 [Flavobacteriales bacterium]|jgi:uncharacterized protein YggE